VLLGTPQKGGIGLTLNEADTLIYYTHSFAWEDRVQSLSRNHRAGQDKPVTIYDLIAPNTLDRKFLRLYEQKQELASVLRDPKTFRAWLLAGD
jgi:SNF2 family DNA or RNA helicase